MKMEHEVEVTEEAARHKIIFKINFLSHGNRKLDPILVLHQNFTYLIVFSCHFRPFFTV